MWPGPVRRCGDDVARAASTTGPLAQADRRDRGCPATSRHRRRGARPRRAAPASRRRARRLRPPPSARAARRCRRRSGCGGRPGRRSPSKTLRLAGSTSARSRGRAARRPSCRTPARLEPPPHLRAERRDREVGQAVEQLVPQRRVAVHQRLRALVGPRRPSLDEVAGDRERRAGEADQRARRARATRGLMVSITYGCRPRVRAAGGGRGRPSRPERLLDHRARARRDVDAEADRRDRHDDVAVEDRGVDAVAPHGLQRDLGRQLGLADRVEDAALARGSRGTRAASGPPGA